jgi:hypothetical protein
MIIKMESALSSRRYRHFFSSAAVFMAALWQTLIASSSASQD